MYRILELNPQLSNCSTYWKLSLIIPNYTTTNSCPIVGSFHFILYLIIRHRISVAFSFLNHFCNFIRQCFSINTNTDI